MEMLSCDQIVCITGIRVLWDCTYIVECIKLFALIKRFSHISFRVPLLWKIACQHKCTLHLHAGFVTATNTFGQGACDSQSMIGSSELDQNPKQLKSDTASNPCTA